MNRTEVLATIIAALFLIGIGAVMAAPNPADNVDLLSSSARTDGTVGTSVEALAGNVSLLRINDTRTTLRWQGYYGNITGQIVLEDGSSNALFDWKIASPQGEIYASNKSTVAWSSVVCFNMTKPQAQQNVTLSALENSLGMGSNDRDGINETFNNSFIGSFNVGSLTFNSNSGCSAAYMNVNDQAQGVDFVEVLLTDNSTDNVIYTALLEQNANGFITGQTFDFQMIVGENGDDSAVTTYYFFVELE